MGWNEDKKTTARLGRGLVHQSNISYQRAIEPAQSHRSSLLASIGLKRINSNKMVKKDSDKMAKKDKKPKHEREDLHEEDGSATNGTPSRVTLSAQSNPDLRSFIYEELETNSNELRQIWQIGECIRVYFKQIGNVHDHYRMQIIQQEEIKSLRALLEDSRTYKEDEMRRLEDENESYKGRFAGFEQAKERLEHEQKTMSRSKAQYEAEVKKVKDKEVHDAIEELVAKHESEKQRVANEHASKVHGLEKDIEKEKKRHSVMQAQVKLEKEQAKARVESLEIDNQSLRGNIKAKQVELECKDEELRNLKALKGLNPRGHQFYMHAFDRLCDCIGDVARQDFQMPTTAKVLDDESAREDLSKASTLFKYALFCGGSPASLFLKVQAVQQCIANVVVSILQRPYYADTVSDAGHQSLSTLLENMASLQATNSNRELSWRLDTIEKLDRLGSEPSSTTPVILTKHEPMRIVTAIMKKLQRFEFSDKKLIISSLSDIADQTISLWDAMRRDNCKVTFNFSISGLDWNRDIYETCTSEEESPQHIDISETDLPKKSFVIFPQVTGHFIAESGHRVLHGGLMLSHESAAFREGLMDIKRAEMRIEELSQNLRKQPITQPSTPRLSHRRASSVSGQHPKATQKSG